MALLLSQSAESFPLPPPPSDWPVPTKLPLIPGHEGAGTVVAIGSAVTNCKVRSASYSDQAKVWHAQRPAFV